MAPGRQGAGRPGPYPGGSFSNFKRKKRDHDFSVNAFRTVQEVIGQLEPEAQKSVKKKKEVDARALGRKGGLKGGKARAEKLTPERRMEIAGSAALARWSKKKE